MTFAGEGRPVQSAGSSQPRLVGYTADGQPIYSAEPVAPATNSLSIAAFVVSLLGFGIVGVVLGHVAMSQIRRSRESGHGLALAALIIGYLSIAVYVVVVLAGIWLYQSG
ncbi:DUF4190 domain-containing protein [Gordonia sp. ABSL49_1]|uniref:DUF4190 domain-containing protein n=1 Tax=Gordonia sp. ABSL49_1 TaxID=2920941 RepID=UPI001F0EF923|nr:DUF4190 domain-containing protein [Gordonia sp. ABSL49_1]MCH5642980.1 DUF4190 domain-containing protein [Gordonia sp. ABSL49_1]